MQNKRTGVYSREQLTRLLHPASIAVIGASTRPGSFGERVLFNMQHYAGRDYPVNARYPTIGEHTCYPNVRDLPEVPDCAVISAAREAVEEIVLDCVKAGVGGAIIFASGYAETGKADRIAQQQRLSAIAQETGHAHRRTQLHRRGQRDCSTAASPSWTSRRSRNRTRNAVGVISQSGALGMALAQGVVRGLSCQPCA